jgi:hypothetical protein
MVLYFFNPFLPFFFFFSTCVYFSQVSVLGITSGPSPSVAMLSFALPPAAGPPAAAASPLLAKVPEAHAPAFRAAAAAAATSHAVFARAASTSSSGWDLFGAVAAGGGVLLVDLEAGAFTLPVLSRAFLLLPFCLVSFFLDRLVF